MELKNLSELPIVFQIIAGFGLFFGTFMLAIGGWLWKSIKPKLPAALQITETPKTEVPISSAQILDSAVFSRLSHSIDRLVEVQTDDGEDSARALDRNYKRLGDIQDEVCRTNEILQRLERHMKDRTIL